MDAISLIQSIIPLLLAIIFTVLAIKSTEELILEQVQSVLAPVWCAVAAVLWTGYAIISVYVATIDYLALFSYVYVGLSVFFWILVPVTIVMDIKLSVSASKDHGDANLGLESEEW